MSDFDGYLMIDWSASSKRVIGSDSIWYCLFTRSGNGPSVVELENPSTRRQAMTEIRFILRDLLDKKSPEMRKQIELEEGWALWVPSRSLL